MINSYFAFKFIKIQSKSLPSLREDTWMVCSAEADSFAEQLARDISHPNLFYPIDPKTGIFRITIYNGISTSGIVECSRDDNLFMPSSETYVCKTMSGSIYGFSDVMFFETREELESYFISRAKPENT